MATSEISSSIGTNLFLAVKMLSANSSLFTINCLPFFVKRICKWIYQHLVCLHMIITSSVCQKIRKKNIRNHSHVSPFPNRLMLIPISKNHFVLALLVRFYHRAQMRWNEFALKSGKVKCLHATDTITLTNRDRKLLVYQHHTVPGEFFTFFRPQCVPKPI